MTNPVFVALDTADLDHARALAAALVGHVGGLKLGLEFFMANGPLGVEAMVAFGLPIFLDVKLHDIANTVAGAARALARLDVAIVNVHAAAGRAAMAAVRDGLPPSTAVIAVTVLTSFDAADLAAGGVDCPVADQVARLAASARSAGLQGIVCAGAEATASRAAWPDAIIAVPGLRLAGGAVGDQKRVMTPRQAQDAGASLLVVGRPITAAPNPAAAAAAIAQSLAPSR